MNFYLEGQTQKFRDGKRHITCHEIEMTDEQDILMLDDRDGFSCLGIPIGNAFAFYCRLMNDMEYDIEYDLRPYFK